MTAERMLPDDQRTEARVAHNKQAFQDLLDERLSTDDLADIVEISTEFQSYEFLRMSLHHARVFSNTLGDTSPEAEATCYRAFLFALDAVTTIDGRFFILDTSHYFAGLAEKPNPAAAMRDDALRYLYDKPATRSLVDDSLNIIDPEQTYHPHARTVCAVTLMLVEQAIATQYWDELSTRDE